MAKSSAAPAHTPQGVYVASRASIPERGKMWRALRDSGFAITSSWIDEDGEGETADFAELWKRITSEIASSSALVLYAEDGDFPLKGALIEAGIALGMGKRVVLCLPGVALDPRSYKPLGSWAHHPLVSRDNVLENALALAESFKSKTPAHQALYEALSALWAGVSDARRKSIGTGANKWDLLIQMPVIWGTIEKMAAALALADAAQEGEGHV